VILGNHSSGNRETPKRDFPNRLKEWATEESARWTGGRFIGVQGLEKQSVWDIASAEFPTGETPIGTRKVSVDLYRGSGF
jgi:hypothetical protein